MNGCCPAARTATVDRLSGGSRGRSGMAEIADRSVRAPKGRAIVEARCGEVWGYRRELTDGHTAKCVLRGETKRAESLMNHRLGENRRRLRWVIRCEQADGAGPGE